MTPEEFLTELAAILEITPTAITMSTELEALENWDSVNILSYMALVDEKFGREVSPDNIAEAKTISDLYSLASGS